MADIVVVEDNTDLRQIIAHILTKAGHSVTEACDGSEILEILAKQPADLVLTDIVMPNQEGIQTIVQIRRHYPHLKIIGMSSGGSEGDGHYLEMAREFGANATLAKPFPKAKLLETVETLLGTVAST